MDKFSNNDRGQRFRFRSQNYRRGHMNNYTRNYRWNNSNARYQHFQNYNQMENHRSISSENQRDGLTEEIEKGSYECMICVERIRANCAVWNCRNCYHIFHIHCIRKWSRSCQNETNNFCWRCPACQYEYKNSETKIRYECYCGKRVEPELNYMTIPHSCGDICERESRISSLCPHLCSILCHPGPCPPCSASLTTSCYCGSVSKLTVKCSTAETNLSCGSICGKLLNCGQHNCELVCHSGSCNKCEKMINQNCFCGSLNNVSIVCGSAETQKSCGSICNKVLDCGFHKCSNICHDGACEVCPFSPGFQLHCPCGQTTIEELEVERVTCSDPFPLCYKICNKPMKHCPHKCPDPCHYGPCAPCKLSSDVRCRCKKTSRHMKCANIAETIMSGDNIRCGNKCGTKKSCGVHRCSEECCPFKQKLHPCTQPCRRLLECKTHRCEEPCHSGTSCPPCSHVSFDELRCGCGTQVIFPPIACGQQPPPCSNECQRPSTCLEHPDAQVSHTCHPDSEPCPPCSFLISKTCPGQHRTFYNIPCHQSVPTCGGPCGKPLTNCSHFCLQLCHSDPCKSECTQPCNEVRSDCGHACLEPCHSHEDAVKSRCQIITTILCTCTHRTLKLACHKLQQVKITLRSELRNESIDLFLSSDNTINLLCNDECKKAARSKQLAEAFQMAHSVSTAAPAVMDSPNIYYNISRLSDPSLHTQFLREFATKNPEFLQMVDKTFTNLMKKLDENKLKKAVHRFSSLNRDKVRFIQEMADQFSLYTRNSDRDIIVEAVKGICKVPPVRLLSYMQKTYPELFKLDKQKNVIRHMPVSVNQISSASYADKMKSIKDLKFPDET